MAGWRTYLAAEVLLNVLLWISLITELLPHLFHVDSN